MILSKILLAATISATVLWLTPMSGNANTSVHQHGTAMCEHSDTDHSAVDAATIGAMAEKMVKCPKCDGKKSFKCDSCDGKKKVDCWSCSGQGKWKETCRTCNGSQVVRVPGKLTAQGCKACGGTGKEKFACSECGGKGKVACSKCNGQGKIWCSTCSGTGKVPQK